MTAPLTPGVGGLGPGEESERFGHVVRSYRMSVSAGALALAWARQENAPHGACVLVEREVSPLGRLTKLWTSPPEATLALALVSRPPLTVEEADAVWLVACLAAAEGAEVASGRSLASWWPDVILERDTDEPVGQVKAEVQLGPGKVRSAVLSLRLDLEKLGVGAEGREGVFEGVLAAFDRHSESLTDGATGVAAAYESRCTLLGRRIKVNLLPKGEARGVARGVDRTGNLNIESGTGMLEQLSIDRLRSYEVV
jgi:BirA family biotin operon repressor/biotin-[acetyl-CoA-carboxylase] ligase